MAKTQHAPKEASPEPHTQQSAPLESTVGLATSAQLSLGSPSDAAESRANRWADAALSGPPQWQRDPLAPAAVSPPGGAPFADRAPFEAAFGYDLSHVRVHADDEGHRAATSVRARAFSVGHHVYLSKRAPAMHTPAGARLMAHELAHIAEGTGKVIRREEDPDLSADDELESREVPTHIDGFDPATGVSNEQRALIETYVTDFIDLISPWEHQRQTTQLVFDSGPLLERTSRFVDEARTLSEALYPTATYGDAVMANPDPLGSDVTFHRALEAKLIGGTYEQWIREIHAFNGDMGPIFTLLGIRPVGYWHYYELQTVVGASNSVGPNVGVSGTVTARAYHIRHVLVPEHGQTEPGDIDIQWSTEVAIGTAGLTIGASVPTPGKSTPSIETPGGTAANAGSEWSMYYRPPEHFVDAIVTYGRAGGSVTVGAEVSTVSFTKNEATLTFDTSGAIVATGKGEAGVSVGAGVSADIPVVEPRRVDPIEEEQILPPPVYSDWVLHNSWLIGFETDSAVLDPGDEDRILDLVTDVINETQQTPRPFRVVVIGAASRLYSGEGGEEAGVAYNNALAHERAGSVATLIGDMTMSGDTPLDMDTLAHSSITTVIRPPAAEAGPQDNRAVDRSARIALYFYDSY